MAAIAEQHWQKFGRNFYTRHDYEAVPTDKAELLVKQLYEKLHKLPGKIFGDRTVRVADDFSYRDPVDNSFSEHQGIRIVFDDGARIIFRLSGTGTEGATLRVYIEKFEDAPDKLLIETQSALKDLIELADELAQIKLLTGRNSPTVIT